MVKKKVKKKLIYSALLLAISVLLLIALTLGWFNPYAKKEVNNMDTYFEGVSINFYKSIDEDFDDLPDRYVDEEGNEGEIIYVPEDTLLVTIEHYFPMYEVFFKSNMVPYDNGSYVRAAFLGLSTPDEQYPGHPENTLDLVDVLCVKFTDPITGIPVDTPLSTLMTAERDVVLFDNYHVPDAEPFVFNFSIYMDKDAEIEYSDMNLVIDKAVFSVTKQEL